jgi:sensor domain CHASE-containing protein
MSIAKFITMLALLVSLVWAGCWVWLVVSFLTFESKEIPEDARK